MNKVTVASKFHAPIVDTLTLVETKDLIACNRIAFSVDPTISERDNLMFFDFGHTTVTVEPVETPTNPMGEFTVELTYNDEVADAKMHGAVTTHTIRTYGAAREIALDNVDRLCISRVRVFSGDKVWFDSEQGS